MEKLLHEKMHAETWYKNKKQVEAFVGALRDMGLEPDVISGEGPLDKITVSADQFLGLRNKVDFG